MKNILTIFLLALGLSAAAMPAAITGTLTVCAGSTTHLTDATSGGTWSCNPTAIATIGTTGIVTGVSAGTAIVTYTTGTGSVTATVTVNISGSSAYVMGPGVVCVSSSVTMSDAVPGGTWSSANPTIATVDASGMVTGLTVGTTFITYVAPGVGCGSVNQYMRVRVNAVAPDPITGVPHTCMYWATGLQDDVPGGVWMSSDVSIATNGDAEGSVYGVSAGTVTYSYSTGCGTDATIIVTVDPVSLPLISGPTSICAGSSTTFIPAVPGGTWTSIHPSVATIGSTDGVAIGLIPGSAYFRYTVTAGCGTMLFDQSVAVVPSPAVPGLFTGSSALCVGTTTTLSPAGTTWSSSNPSVATAVYSGGNGLVTGVSAGTATVTRITTNSCGTSTATGTVTVNPYVAPSSGTITGPGTVLTGSSISLTDAIPGGTWSSSPYMITTVDPTGAVTGIRPGTSTVNYVVTTACGSSTASTIVTVNSSIAPITGPTNVCVGSSTALTDATTGGTWSTNGSPYLAVGSATGIVSGLWPGFATVIYTMPSGAAATYVVSVNTIPGATPISGASTVGIGGSITLSDAYSGGVWSSDNLSVASVSSSGNVTGASAGTATISYSFTSTCAGAAFTHIVNVPSSIAPIGSPATACTGSSLTLTDATGGGTWSSSNPTVGSIALVSGFVFLRALTVGTTTLSYTVGGGSVTQIVTVNPSPLHISGPGVDSAAELGFVCIGGTTHVYDATPGGTWAAYGGGVYSDVSIDAAGNVTGISSGPVGASIAYTNSYGCMATIDMNVLPAMSPVTGSPVVCQGSTTMLSDAFPYAGSWTTSDPSIAGIGTTGLVTGVSGGTATISYEVNGNSGCLATQVVTVNVCGGTIMGGLYVCVGSTTSLSDATGGGTWSSGSPGIASVGSTGIVTGIAAGTAAISYTVGASVTSVVVTVSLSASAGTITGTATVCPGSTTNLTDAVGGGTWSSSNTLVATVGSATGIVTGATAGTATIYYAVSNGCGTATANRVVTVNASSSAGTITGTATICGGASTTLSDAVAGGTWSSVSPAVATIGSTGIVTGVAAGTSIISYSIINSCGTLTAATRTVTVNGTPNAGAIAGTTTVCGGGTTALTDAAGGGVWASGATGIATVSTAGVVTGITAGTATISYTVTNSCGTATATVAVTVTGSSAGTIAGVSTVITGTTINLTDAISGGVWSASNGNATVSASGVVTGITPGTVTISYTVTSGCGSLSATKLITVSNATSVSAISGYYFYLCTGANATFWDATTGGSWSMTPASVATVSATGIVTGISAGTATLTYTYGSIPVTATVTVYATPAAVTGSSIACVGTTAALTDATPGGTWSSSTTTIATISTAGVVTGVMAGTSTIYYTGAAGCKASQVFTVTPAPSGIGGASSVCTGSSISLSDLTAGGTWSSTAPASVVATGTATALATGVTTGTAIITYSLGTGCYRTFNLTVKPVPAPVSGTLTACVGSVTHLSDATTPGISWTSSNALVGTISASGGVTGISGGTATMTYTASNACIATAVVTVNALPVVAAITGPSTLSHGGGATLYTDATAGGVWSSTHATVISIGSASGLAAAVATSGTSTVSYTVTDVNGCVAAATKNVSAAPAPHGHGGSATTIVDAAASLAQEAMMDVRLIPNPNNGTFTVTGTTGADKDEAITLQVTSISGQVVYTGKAKAANGAINATVTLNSNFANGMYLLNINSENGNKVFRFVVEK